MFDQPVEEAKMAPLKVASQVNSNSMTDGEELLFSARLMEEGDSSGYIYASRNDDSGLLMASGVEQAMADSNANIFPAHDAWGRTSDQSLS